MCAHFLAGLSSYEDREDPYLSLLTFVLQDKGKVFPAIPPLPLRTKEMSY